MWQEKVSVGNTTPKCHEATDKENEKRAICFIFVRYVCHAKKIDSETKINYLVSGAI